MSKKLTAVFFVFVLTVALNIPVSYAADKANEPNPVISGASSLVLPPTGQIINKEGTKTKSLIMGTIEAGAITALVLTATLVGGPIVWVGIGPLIANHVWSGTEAFATAKRKSREAGETCPMASSQMTAPTAPSSSSAPAQPVQDKKKTEESQSVVK